MKVHYYFISTVMLLIFVGCSHKANKVSSKESASSQASQIQTESDPQYVQAREKADKLTEGWPESSATAATEMIQKHGEPNEVTDDSLVWSRIAPFERIVVHKEVHSSKFPVLHQNAVEHVVTYKVPDNMMDALREFSGDIIVDTTKGLMTASGDKEALNILSLNLADDVLKGKISPEEARTQLGKEYLNFMNGEQTAYTQNLKFGPQSDTGDRGKSITRKIQWDEGASQKTRQSQESNQDESQPDKVE